MQPEDDSKKDLATRFVKTILEKPRLLEEIARRLESNEIADADGEPIED